MRNIKLFENIYHEIDETENLLDHIGGGMILGDDRDVNDDIKMMKFKIDVLRTAIRMVKKSAVDIEGVDALWAMNPKERRMLFKVVRISVKAFIFHPVLNNIGESLYKIVAVGLL